MMKYLKNLSPRLKEFLVQFKPSTYTIIFDLVEQIYSSKILSILEKDNLNFIFTNEAILNEFTDIREIIKSIYHSLELKYDNLV